MSVDRGFSRYLAVLFSRRDLDLSSSSFLHSVINLRPPSVTVSVQLWASRAARFLLLDLERPDVAFHTCRPLFLLPAPSFLDPIFYCPEHNTLGEPSMRIRAPAHNNLLARNVASILSHPVSSSVRLYERTRWSDLRHLAPMMRKSTLWRTVRNFL